jgi:hypothetical protein
MKFVLERVTQPDIEPVTLADMKVSLREFTQVTALDGDITSFIQGAREWVEDFTGRALIDQTWRLSIGEERWLTWLYPQRNTNVVTPINLSTWSHNRDGIYLRKSPALSIVSFVTVGTDGVETTVDPTTYELRDANSKWPRLFGLNGATWTPPMRITFRAGYADRASSPQQDTSVVPVRFVHAMKLWVEANYDRDEKMMSQLLDTAERLITPERCELGIA